MTPDIALEISSGHVRRRHEPRAHFFSRPTDGDTASDDGRGCSVCDGAEKHRGLESDGTRLARLFEIRAGGLLYRRGRGKRRGHGDVDWLRESLWLDWNGPRASRRTTPRD